MVHRRCIVLDGVRHEVVVKISRCLISSAELRLGAQNKFVNPLRSASCPILTVAVIVRGNLALDLWNGVVFQRKKLLLDLFLLKHRVTALLEVREVHSSTPSQRILSQRPAIVDLACSLGLHLRKTWFCPISLSQRLLRSLLLSTKRLAHSSVLLALIRSRHIATMFKEVRMSFGSSLSLLGDLDVSLHGFDLIIVLHFTVWPLE